MSANVASASAPIAIRSSPPLQGEDADEHASEVGSEESSSRSCSCSEASNAALFGPTSTHTLEEAITSATLPRLRTVLLKMCRQDPVCVALASKELLVEAKTRGREGGDAITATKRHRKAYEMCSQCHVEYDVKENAVRGKAHGLCKYHPGEKELQSDADFWGDYDEGCYGDMESLIDEPDFADGFVWTCCEMVGSAPPCRTTKHRPVEKGNKRARWD
ncbi:hypothetical protein PV04_06746 [Phialophora macrospora]|uniref:C2H2-type domain-containing protein n=1 Tax=Phialophora macrospora TaxID=1851006 RepID=A0A0D2DZH4_9EURO|nr:hypothetical protein PV04_06746 [Phialophora macrospora]